MPLADPGERAVVRLARKTAAGFDVRGMGFLMADGNVMTCAHVVCEIADVAIVDADPNAIGFQQVAHCELWGNFFVVSDEDAWISLKVISEEGWFEPLGRDDQGGFYDIAVLKPDAPPPADTEGATLSRTLPVDPDLRRSLAAVGITDRSPLIRPHWIGCHYRGSLGDVGQLGPADDKSFIVQGYSGTAVWNSVKTEAYGMVIFKRREGYMNMIDERAAYFIPAKNLLQAWPDAETGAAAPDPADAPLTNPFIFVDRDIQGFDFEDAFDGMTKAGKQLLVFVCPGPDVEEHRYLADRFAVADFASLARAGAQASAEPVGDLGVRRSVERDADRLMTMLARRISADDETPAALARRLSEDFGPKTFYYTLAAPDIEGDAIALIERWAAGWNAIVAAGLSRPVAVFVALTSEDGRDAERMETVGGIVEGILERGHVFAETEPLGPVSRNDALTWVRDVLVHRADINLSALELEHIVDAAIPDAAQPLRLFKREFDIRIFGD